MKLFKRWWAGLLTVGILAGGTYAILIATDNIPWRKSTPATIKKSPPIAVMAEAAQKTDFRIFITSLGSVTPLQTVVVRPRVDGHLMAVLYREGQTVEKGDLLARIDPRPFEVQLAQAQGQMVRDQAFLNNAKQDLQRYRLLWEQDSISRQQLDTQEALVRQHEGILKTDQAAIDSARLQLAYCRITAPISGRLGLRLVDPGNMVRASDTNGLVVITQVEPISVVFSIPEDNLPLVLAKLKTGERLPVLAYDRELKQRLATGYLMTMDNQIDSGTGTVRLRGVFANKDQMLFPNQFVNARLLVDTRKDATVVPASAIQRGPRGAFVYVVKPEKTVTVRPIVIDHIQGGLASVKSGLAPEELVVVDGSERLREEARVELRARSRRAEGTAKPGVPSNETTPPAADNTASRVK